MSDKDPSAAEVWSVREQLGWSRVHLAARLGVTSSAVRAWEEGRNPCTGPAAVLLRLLARQPGVLDDPLTPLPGLPMPDAAVGSDEWFRTQRLLGLLLDTELQGYGYWSDLVAEEALHATWLEDMEHAMLLRQSSRNREIRMTTEAAYTSFRLDLWKSWVHETYGEDYDSRELEPMPHSEYERRNHMGTR